MPGAEDILDMVEDLSKLDIWYQVFYTQVTGYLPSNIYNIYTMISTQDWHPADHISFFSNLGLRQLDPTWLSVNNTNVADISMFDEVDIYQYLYYLSTSIYIIYLSIYLQVVFKRYPPYRQKLWPDHCIQGSDGRCQCRKYAKIFIIY